MIRDGSGASFLSALAVEASWDNLGDLMNVLRTFGCIEAQNESVGNLDVDNKRFMTYQ